MDAETNTSKEIVDLAKAIAFAEGFGVTGAVPTRAHNPGDLKLSGYPTTGDEGIAVFPDDETGWSHLYNQLNRIKSNNSHVYSPNMTFTQFARIWTDTAQSAWLDNVLKHLVFLGYNVDGTTFLKDFFVM